MPSTDDLLKLIQGGANGVTIVGVIVGYYLVGKLNEVITLLKSIPILVQEIAAIDTRVHGVEKNIEDLGKDIDHLADDVHAIKSKGERRKET